MGATIWWDARIRRRERLDDAAIALSNAASRMGELAMKRLLGMPVPGDEATVAFRAVQDALALARTLALRRTLGLPLKCVAPWRFGFADTVNGLLGGLRIVAKKFSVANQKEAETIVRYTMALDVAGRQWIQNPRRFRKGSIAKALYEEAKKEDLSSV